MRTRNSFIIGVVSTLLGVLMVCAAPIRSMLGMDTEVLEPPRPSASEYIQDGLVSMFDAVENVDWGVHDSTTTNWVDLITGQKAYPTNASRNHQHFEDSALVVTVRNMPQYVIPNEYGFMNSAEYTVEMCVTPSLANAAYSTSANLTLHGNRGNKTANSLFIHYLLNTSDSTSGRFAFSLYYGYAVSYENEADALPWGVMRTSSITSSNVPDPTSGYRLSLYDNGVLWSGYTNTRNPQGGKWGLGGTWTQGSMLGQIHCFRVYNRRLTPEEVEYNYMVDVERFGTR